MRMYDTNVTRRFVVEDNLIVRLIENGRTKEQIQATTKDEAEKIGEEWVSAAPQLLTE